MESKAAKRSLVTTIAFFEGLTHLAALAVFYTFKDRYSLDPHEVAMLSVVPTLPWLFKVVIAVYIDVKPINYQHRRPYIMIGSFLNCFGYVFLGYVHRLPLSVCLVFLFIASFGSAVCSTASDAIVIGLAQSEAENADPEIRAHVSTIQVSSYFAAKALGSLIVSYASGALLEILSAETIFLATSTFPLVVGLLSVRVEEDRVQPNAQTIDEPLTTSIKEKFATGCNTIYSCGLLWPVLFNLLFIMPPDYDEALMFYIINRLGFGPTFIGTLRLTYGLASLIGLAVYQLFLTNYSIKSLLVGTTLSLFPFYIMPVFMVLRYNLLVGIPDGLFLIGGGFMTEAIAEVQLMPIFMLASAVCPPGSEATVLSIITSSRTAAAMIGKALGATLMAVLRIDRYSFDNLPALIVLCSVLCLTPLIVTHKLSSEVQNGSKVQGYETQNSRNATRDKLSEKASLLFGTENVNTEGRAANVNHDVILS